MHRFQLKNNSILVISDTHGKHRKLSIPDGIDIIIHCGDICDDGNPKQIADFFEWYSALPIPHKLFVHGNHDWPFEFEPEQATGLLPENVRWLTNAWITVNGIKIGALSHDFYFHPLQLPKRLDILVTHQPPRGILDDGLGCLDLRDFVMTRPSDYHFFGHIHTATGKKATQETTYFNVSDYLELCQNGNQ